MDWITYNFHQKVKNGPQSLDIDRQHSSAPNVESLHVDCHTAKVNC